MKAQRIIAAVAIAAGIGAAGRYFFQRSRSIARVAPELKNAGLWLPLDLTNRAGLTIARRMLARTTEPVADVAVESVHIDGGLDGYLYTPAGSAPRGALLWIHGGGLVAGQPEADHDFCSRVARDAGCRVLSVRYRLAPEHPFPAGFDDVFAGLLWLHHHAEELGLDAGRIAVGGASAGGGLAAVVAQRAHDQGVPVAFQALVYPMLDDRTVLTSTPQRSAALGWTAPSNRYAWTAYLGRKPRFTESRQYVATSRREDLTGLPPAWIGVGDLDLFRDEDLDYARRLGDVGVTTETRVEPGMYHAADVALATTVPSMARFQQSLVDALSAAIGGR